MVGGVGNILRNEAIPVNRHFGFRLKALMQTETAWRTGSRLGGIVLHVLSGIGMLAVIVFASKSN
jgi:uncharacterized membrane protein